MENIIHYAIDESGTYIGKMFIVPVVAQSESLEGLIQELKAMAEVYNEEVSEELKSLDYKPIKVSEFELLEPDADYYRRRYEKCLKVIKRFDPGIISMYDL